MSGAALRIPGERIYLQEFSEENLLDPRYHGWLRDLEVVRNIYRVEYLMPLQFAEVETYVRSLMASDRDCYFALYEASEDAYIGTVKVGHIDWRAGLADIGIIIGESRFRGRGLAVDAVRTACSYAFNELSLRKMTGGTASTNAAMCRCFERVGFVEEGRLRKQLLISGEYCDHVLYGLLKEEFKAK